MGVSVNSMEQINKASGSLNALDELESLFTSPPPNKALNYISTQSFEQNFTNLCKAFKTHSISVRQSNSLHSIPQTAKNQTATSYSRKGSWANLEAEYPQDLLLKPTESSSNPADLDSRLGASAILKLSNCASNGAAKLADDKSVFENSSSLKNMTKPASSAKKLQQQAQSQSRNNSNNALSQNLKEQSKSKTNLQNETPVEQPSKPSRKPAPVIYLNNPSGSSADAQSANDNASLANLAKTNAQKPSSCDVRGWSPSALQFSIFLECFTHNPVTELRLWNCYFSREVFIQTLQALANSDVKTVVFDSCTFGSPNLLPLLLQERLHLVSLSLRNCHIDDRQLSEIAVALKNNHKLRALSLSMNRFTSKGLNELAGALNYNQSLLYLDLSRNNLSDKCVQALSRVLGKHQSSGEDKLGLIYWYQQSPTVSATNEASPLIQSSVAEIFRLAVANASGKSQDSSSYWSAKKPTTAGDAPSAATKSASNTGSALPVQQASKPGAKSTTKTAASSSSNTTTTAGNATALQQTLPNAASSQQSGNASTGPQTNNAATSQAAGGSTRKNRASTKSDERDAASDAQLLLANDIRVELDTLLQLFFDEDGISYRLGNRTLAMLNLEGCNLTEPLLEPLIQAVKYQIETKDRSDAVFKSMSGCTGLFHINLGGNRLLAINNSCGSQMTSLPGAGPTAANPASSNRKENVPGSQLAQSSAGQVTQPSSGQKATKPKPQNGSANQGALNMSSQASGSAIFGVGNALQSGNAAGLIPPASAGFKQVAEDVPAEAKVLSNSQKLQNMLTARNPFIKAERINSASTKPKL